jgi:biopolymer transport protein ExbD
MERYLNLFSLAFLGVVFTLFLTVFSVTPIVCDLGARVNVPWASTSTRLPEADTDLTITVRADGHVFVGPNVVPQRFLDAELASIARRSGTDRHVLIRAHGALKFGAVQDVLAASSRAGFRRMSLVTFRGTALEAFERGGAV